MHALHVAADPFVGIRRAVTFPGFEGILRKCGDASVADDLEKIVDEGAVLQGPREQLVVQHHVGE